MAPFLTGEEVPLHLHPTILKEKRPCFGEGIINGANPVFFFWQNQPSAFPFPWYPGIGNRLLEGRKKDGVFEAQNEDKRGWKSVEVTFSGGFGEDNAGGRIDR